MTVLVNNGITQQTISIIGPNGEQKEIFLQPRGRLSVPVFWKLDNNQSLPLSIAVNGTPSTDTTLADKRIASSKEEKLSASSESTTTQKK